MSNTASAPLLLGRTRTSGSGRAGAGKRMASVTVGQCTSCR